MSSKMLTQNALWEQDLSQDIDEAVETDPEIRDTDQAFEEQIAFLRNILRKKPGIISIRFYWKSATTTAT